MKKPWIAFLAALLLFTACQPTPEAELVVRKNTEQMIEAAQGTPAAPPVKAAESGLSPLYDRLSVPERYAVTIAPNSKKFSVTMDAAVVLPAAAGMPTVRIRARAFTQDEVYRLFNAFCGDTVMYYETAGVSRADYEEMLISNQKDLIELKKDGASAEVIASVEERIAWVERQILTAPETVPAEVCDGTMRETEQRVTDSFLANRMQLDAVDGEGLGYSSRGRLFTAVGNVYNINEKTFTDYETNSAVCYSAGRGGESFLYNPVEYIADESTVPAEAEGELILTPAGARAIVERFWLKNGFSDLVVQGVYLAHNRKAVTLEDPYGERHAYAVVCGYAVNGTVPRLLGECAYSHIGEDAYGISWAYERCYFFVDDEGIISFQWNSPNEYLEVVAEDTALLPFEKICEIFQKMMLIKYEAEAASEYIKHLTYHIDRVALELQRVAEQDSVETGLLIPVWNFYGTWFCEYNDGHLRSAKDRQGFPWSFLTINAIDGSIIDPGAGY